MGIDSLSNDSDSSSEAIPDNLDQQKRLELPFTQTQILEIYNKIE